MKTEWYCHPCNSWFKSSAKDPRCPDCKQSVDLSQGQVPPSADIAECQTCGALGSQAHAPGCKGG